MALLLAQQDWLVGLIGARVFQSIQSLCFTSLKEDEGIKYLVSKKCLEIRSGL